VTFDPPWNPKMMTDFAREKLGFEPTKSPKNDQKINVEWE
jgi:metal-sulfur cluster biosynthetic enzyme